MEQNKPKEEETPQSIKKWSNWKIILLNIGLMVLVGLLLIWATMGFINRYTKHDQAFRLADIRGLSQTEAMEKLAESHLYMEVTDSIYVEGKAPGVVLETTPRAGALIKSDRTIYVTVNTNSTKKISIPAYQELSERSVEMMLKGAGFVNITKEYVPGEHNLLVLRIKDSTTGRYLIPGDRIPYNTPITMEVSSSDAYETAILDSLELNDTDASLEPTHHVNRDPEVLGNGEDWF